MVDDGKVGSFEIKYCDDCDTSVFSDSTELPDFISARKSNRNYVMAKTCVNTEDFLELQARMSGVSKQRIINTRRRNPERIEDIKRGIKKKHEVPIPVVPLHNDGTLEGFQEGAHRAVAAFDLEIRCIPIYLAIRTEDNLKRNKLHLDFDNGLY